MPKIYVQHCQVEYIKNCGEYPRYHLDIYMTDITDGAILKDSAVLPLSAIRKRISETVKTIVQEEMEKANNEQH